MAAVSAETWPWLAMAALGAFDGLNPAMGWLFAVALGLHRGDRRVVLLSPIWIALGHAASVAAVAALFIWTGSVIDPHIVRIGGGCVLIGWAAWHWRYGHRHRVRFGMQAGAAALVAWSLLMGTAHGAGLMLWPVLMPLCASSGATTGGPLVTALMGVAVHTLAMLTVATAIAIAVYEWVGLAILRHAWINCDLIWTVGLVAAGIVLLVT